MNRIISLVLTCAGLILAAWILLPIPMPGDAGAYNYVSRLYWCQGEQACLHERGHALDQALGWPSRREGFWFDVEVYLISEIERGNPSSMAGAILQVWQNPPRRWGDEINVEMYAEIYREAGGELERIPDGLKKYYGGR